MTDIVLITTEHMPKPDPESHLLVDELAALGISAEMRTWQDPEFDWGAAPLTVSRTPWDYFDHPESFWAWARDVAARTRLENPIEVMAWNGHKSYLLDLERAGVPLVPTTLVPQAAGKEERARAFDAHGASDVVVKPAISGGAQGARRGGAATPEMRDHLRGLTVVGDVLVQPYLDAVERSGETSLILFGSEPSHAVRKLPAGGDYRVQEIHGGRLEDHAPTEAELAVARAALAAAPGPTAYARIDLVDGDSGPLLMEAELIEPELFLPVDRQAAGRFARVLEGRLR